MAAVRGEGDDLPARCISLLQEVKDLMEAHKSGPENTDETAAFTSRERQARPSSSTVQQQLGNNATQQRVMQNFRSLFAPYSEMLRLILQENSFQFNGENYLQTHGTAMGTKMAVAFANIFMAAVETKILS